MEPIIDATINVAKAQEAYNVIVDALSGIDFNKGELLVGLLVIVGTQYHGGAMAPKVTQQYVEDMMEYLAVYFGAGGGDIKH